MQSAHFLDALILEKLNVQSLFVNRSRVDFATLFKDCIVIFVIADGAVGVEMQRRSTQLL